MKYKIILCALFLPMLIWSQEKLNNLKAPTSPASGILGLQPTAVLSPKSYRALETAVYSNFINNYSPVIPNDFALEFTPYWAKNHSLSLDDYLFPKRISDQWIRSSSFSVASTQNFLLGDSTATNALAFGYRTSFFFGNKRDRDTLLNYISNSLKIKNINIKITAQAYSLVYNDTIVSKNDFLESIRNTIFESFKRYENTKDSERLTNKIIAESMAILPELNKENPDDFLSSFENILDSVLQGESLFNKFESYIRNRQGFSVDIAYASLFNFPANQFESSFVPRQSVWVTPTYQFKNNLNFLKVMAVLRYEWYNLGYYNQYFPDFDIYKNNTDYGLAVSTELDKCSLQFELVGRSSNSEIRVGTDLDGNVLYRKEIRSDIQYIGSFNYNLTDQIVISYSIGKGFEKVDGSKNTLVSKLSLNFGFGTPTQNNIK